MSLSEMVTLPCFKKSFLVWMWFQYLVYQRIKKEEKKKKKVGLDVLSYMFPGRNTKLVRALHLVMTLSLMSVYQSLDATSISRDP